jgi:hypothetical protein
VAGPIHPQNRSVNKPLKKPVKNRKPETKTGGLVVCSGSEEAVIFQKK